MYNVDISKNDVIRLVGTGSSACTVSIQDITVGTTTELKYYSVASSTWVASYVANSMTVSPTDPLVYFFTFDSSVLATALAPQQFLIVIKSNASVVDSFVLSVGSSQISRLVSAVAPAKRTITRNTDTQVIVSSYADAAGTKETLRYQISQDVSGNQPEETQLDISSSI